MLTYELFESQILTERLGNLSQLKVGSMINILRQPASGKDGKYTGPVDKSFANSYSRDALGNTSEIIDGGQLKLPFIGSLRKAMKTHETAEAFAIYVDNKAVCFGRWNSYLLAGPARASVLAYDLGAFKDVLDASFEAKLAAKNENAWTQTMARNNRGHLQHSGQSAYQQDRDSWKVTDAERAAGKIPQDKYQGRLTSTANLKSFLEELESLAVDHRVTFKLALSDSVGISKRRDRMMMNHSELYSGLDALAARLKKFKLAKKPTVANIDEFINATKQSNTLQVVQFAGVTYNTKSAAGSTHSAEAILGGVTFSLQYSAVDGSYESLKINYKFDQETLMVRPYSAVYLGKDPATGKSERVTAVLEPTVYLKDVLKVKTLSKEAIMKSVLTSLKDGKYAQVESAIDAARSAGHDYPEFTAIEKSVKASRQASKT